MMEMMNDPGTSEALNQMMSNPQVIDQMLRHPMFQGNPQMRQALQNPEMRRQIFSPEAIRQAMMLQRSMQQMGMGDMGMGMGGAPGGRPAFPAPGTTDQTAGEQRAPASTNTSANPGAGAPVPNPFGPAAGGFDPFSTLFGAGGQPPLGTTATDPLAANATGLPNANGPNPFAALFGQPPAGTAGSPMQGSPFGIPGPTGATPPSYMNNMMQQMMQAQQMQAPADTRPPEVRYEEQLQQLNAMGLHDFERNVAALRRSGGNVQAAIEFLFST